MKDSFGREINYMRISVTDRCNLRCRYCMPPEGIVTAERANVLSFDEILRVARAGVWLGINRLRLTGGEPLARRGLAELVRDLAAIPGVESLALTTNGVLLGDMLADLAAAGLTGVNVSIDTLDRRKFAELTGADALDAVLASLRRALAVPGLSVKVNAVMLAGFNDDEIVRLAGLAAGDDVAVRFIEMMPIGRGRDFKTVSRDEVLAELEGVYGQPRAVRGDGAGPAVYYRFPHMRGRIGFISALSHNFCDGCNKLRLTAEGLIKPCLQYESGYDLRGLLRGGAGEREIAGAIAEAIRNKPRSHRFGESCIPGGESKPMFKIGG